MLQVQDLNNMNQALTERIKVLTMGAPEIQCDELCSENETLIQENNALRQENEDL